MIEAEHCQPEERNLVEKMEKGFFDLLNPLIVVEMLRIDVGHHSNGGHQFKKGPIALIRLGNQKLSLPQLRITADAVQSSSDDHGWIEPGRTQNRGNEGGCRRLSMGPCNGDAHLHPHQFRQHLCPRNDGDEPLLSHFDFRIVRTNGGGDDQDVCLFHILPLMAIINFASQSLEPPGHLCLLHVRTADPIPQVKQNLGDSAHPDAADPDEMDVSDLPFSIHNPSNHQSPNSKSQIISNHQIQMTKRFGHW